MAIGRTQHTPSSARRDSGSVLATSWQLGALKRTGGFYDYQGVMQLTR